MSLHTKVVLSALLVLFTSLHAAAQTSVQHDHAVIAQQSNRDADVQSAEVDHSKMSHSMPANEVVSSKLGMEQAMASSLRDPHGYSSGYTLTSGPYALPPKNRLKLADEYNFWSILFDRFEFSRPETDDVISYDAQAWFGKTFNRLVVKAEGDIVDGNLEEAETEILWSRAIYTYWDTQLGIRQDTIEGGDDRTWLAFGIQGVAPYWFETNVTAYIGEGGDTQLLINSEYEMRINQRLIAQPRVEFNFAGYDDPANGVGKGVTDGLVGLRLRYEFSREFAPYIGVEHVRLFGDTKELATGEGESIRDTLVVVGLRFWF